MIHRSICLISGCRISTVLCSAKRFLFSGLDWINFGSRESDDFVYNFCGLLLCNSSLNLRHPNNLKHLKKSANYTKVR